MIAHGSEQTSSSASPTTWSSHVPRRRRASGFTILELVVVLAILALLAGTATVGLMATLGRAKVSTTKNDIQTVGQAIQNFQVNQGRLPPDLQTLVVGEYLSKPSDIQDAWGNTFVYQAPSTYSGQAVEWLLMSMGENGTYEGEGLGDDIFFARGFDVE